MMLVFKRKGYLHSLGIFEKHLYKAEIRILFEIISYRLRSLKSILLNVFSLSSSPLPLLFCSYVTFTINPSL